MENIKYFALDRISDNPYQPRMNEDLEHIMSVAKSIAIDGLLQNPVGRMVTVSEVQLAFGHTRLRAHRLLAGGQVEGVNNPEDFALFHSALNIYRA